jgi:hypothetical protein
LTSLVNGIVVTHDQWGNVVLQHGQWAASEPGRATFVMTPHEWEDFLIRAAMAELERRKLPQASARAEVPDSELAERVATG